MTVIRNMTAHTVTVLDEDGDEDGNFATAAAYEPSGETVTIATREHDEPICIGNADGRWTYVADMEYLGPNIDLPRGFGLYYIVPLQVAISVRRRDFLVPLDPIYGDDGKRIGVKGLGRFT